MINIKSLSMAAAFLLMPLHVAIAAPTSSTQISQSDEQQITAWAKRWKQLLEAGRIEHMRDMYETDAVLMSNGAPPQIGVDAILKFLGRNRAAGNNVSIDFANEDLTIEDDRAYLTAKYWMTITLNRGSTINIMGRSFLVFKKGQDRKWRLWKDMDNQAPDIVPEGRPN